MNIWPIVKKELKDFFISPVAYIVLSLFTISIGAYWAKDLFLQNQAEMRSIFEIIPLVFIVVIPSFTMRSWAEEKQEGTFELLTTMPVKLKDLLIAKFLSSLIFAVIILLMTLPIPLILNLIGNPDNGVILGGYISLIFLSSAYIAIGQLVSINSTNQISALLVSIAIIGLLYLVGENVFLDLVQFKDFFSNIALGSHFRSIAKGVLDSRDIIYYLSVVAIFQSGVYQSLIRISKIGK